MRALSSRGANNENLTAFETGQFKTELADLKAALENMDAKVMNETVSNLSKLACADDLKAAVEKIVKHILMVEYDEAGALIESLLRKC